MSEDRRLIEVAFPLEQTSLDSVHEKSVRHGHISTLHIWPARRPLAACRAALVATLLPDPGNEAERKALVERLGGRVVESSKRQSGSEGGGEDRVVRQTVGGILHWGRESNSDVAWFRDRIREAFGGRAPRVLDPFAGGGAIPLEAMRLGCEAVAGDLNPVAWLILKCTLEYPHRLAGQVWPLPSFALESSEFTDAFRKRRKGGTRKAEPVQGPQLFPKPQAEHADLAWHVRAWGQWVIDGVRGELGKYYPVVEGKTTIAYLWARTVRCKNCRATIPLLKTRWLSRKENNRVLLAMAAKPDETGVVFAVQPGGPVVGESRAERASHDKQIGGGTMSRAGAWCPCCGKPGTVAMTMEDIRQEGLAGRLGAVLTAVVAGCKTGRCFRLATEDELKLAEVSEERIAEAFRGLPLSLPDEPLPSKEALGIRVPLYGLDRWNKLFNPRQLLALASLTKYTLAARDAIQGHGYPREWVEALAAYLVLAIDKSADRNSSLSTWDVSRQTVRNVFTRFALPIVWDYCESNLFSDSTANYAACIDWIAGVINHVTQTALERPVPVVLFRSATAPPNALVDLVLTDPPYYDAIPYSDLMDFFYVWLRRSLHGLSPEIDQVFSSPLSPKWDHAAGDGELIDDSSRFGGDSAKSRAAYEEGMFRSFAACHKALRPDGRMVVVFAHKHPDAWQALVGAIIRAGFVVRASWPLQTELGNRTRALSSAALSSSVWLVCAKRPADARPGWDNRVLEAMRDRLYGKHDPGGKWALEPRLHQFWDAGIRGPDFVWSATGPALEAYSQYPVVKRANEPGKIVEVSEFLASVRRMVVDFVVGRLLSGNGGDGVTGLDDVTTYYLLHRHTFGLEDAPAGACILYAISSGLSDSDLAGQLDVLSRSGGTPRGGEDEDDDEKESTDTEDETRPAGSGASFRLKPWSQRRGRLLGQESPGGRPAPLIDQVHRLMHLWKAGDSSQVDDYVETMGLRRQTLFHQVLQALIELASGGSSERSLLESISNHLGSRAVKPPTLFPNETV
ncbi:MAG: DUF1156 domain-containing protein [Bacillota bacterium]|nr:DUF1156 domain-containing protein [Bacillota bacterium]